MKYLIWYSLMKSAQHKVGSEMAQSASLMLPWSASLFPDEDVANYETLKRDLFGDLSPRTPYERVLAENLVELEWEALRSRRLKAGILKSVFRYTAAETIHRIVPPAFIGTVTMSVAFGIVRDLLSSDGERRAEAEAKLSEMEIDPIELTAVTYQACAKDLEPLERNLEAIERRRRNLLEDFRKLQNLPIREIDEVQLLEEDE